MAFNPNNMFVSKSKYRQLEKDFNTVMNIKNELIKELHELKYRGMRRLTRGEALTLARCIYFYGDYEVIYSSDLLNSETPQLSNLVKKGYLKRTKRGQYTLSFI
jgi:hypothetical protein